MSEDQVFIPPALQSDGLAELFAALALAQAEMPNAGLNKVNPHFNSRYADLAAIREATLPSLTKHGLSICQYFDIAGDRLILMTLLAHKNGGRIESHYPIALDAPQKMGSAITYGRRYSWASMCGVAYEDDDDANEASKSEVKQKSAYKTRKDGDYEALAALIDECSTKAELRAMFNTHREKIEAMPDSWQKHLREHYARHIEGLAE